MKVNYKKNLEFKERLKENKIAFKHYNILVIVIMQCVFASNLKVIIYV